MPTWLESGFVWSFIKIDPKFGELIRETRNTLNENRERNTECKLSIKFFLHLAPSSRLSFDITIVKLASTHPRHVDTVAKEQPDSHHR